MTTVMQAPAPARNYGELFHKINNLQGKEKQLFCRTLTLDEKRAYIEHLKERNSDMVTGIFRCFEPIGGSVKMTAMAFGGEDPITYEFLDGQEYTIPRYIAKRFESEFQGSGTWYPTHGHIMDQYGKPMVGVGKKNRRFGFSSMDFQ